MTDDASTGAQESTDADAGADPNDYDEMLATLDVAIKEARRKVDSGRVYDPENERVRIKWIRALAYAVNVRRQVTNDRDLAELTERVEALEDATGHAGLKDTLLDDGDGEDVPVDLDGVDT
jgi:hypothetical protein